MGQDKLLIQEPLTWFLAFRLVCPYVHTAHSLYLSSVSVLNKIFHGHPLPSRCNVWATYMDPVWTTGSLIFRLMFILQPIFGPYLYLQDRQPPASPWLNSHASIANSVTSLIPCILDFPLALDISWLLPPDTSSPFSWHNSSSCVETWSD